MGAEQKTHFLLDKNKCTKCGRCINTCSGMVLAFGPDGYPEMKAFERFGWRGCWKCQHCLAVCPQGAISIFDKKSGGFFTPASAGNGTLYGAACGEPPLLPSVSGQGC